MPCFQRLNQVEAAGVDCSAPIVDMNPKPVPLRAWSLSIDEARPRNLLNRPRFGPVGH